MTTQSRCFYPLHSDQEISKAIKVVYVSDPLETENAPLHHQMKLMDLKNNKNLIMKLQDKKTVLNIKKVQLNIQSYENWQEKLSFLKALTRRNSILKNKALK